MDKEISTTKQLFEKQKKRKRRKSLLKRSQLFQQPKKIKKRKTRKSLLKRSKPLKYKRPASPPPPPIQYQLFHSHLCPIQPPTYPYLAPLIPVDTIKPVPPLIPLSPIFNNYQKSSSSGEPIDVKNWDT